MTEAELMFERGKAFCIAAHSAVAQTRKYTGDPYWMHPFNVSLLVADAYPEAPWEVLVGALLHDVVEDTGVTFDDIQGAFGHRVAELVDQVTDVSRPEDGNRAARKAKDLLHLARACPDAKTIKLADIIDNTTSIVEHDPKFAEVYLREKEALLGVLTEGNATLFRVAKMGVACAKAAA